MPSLDFKGKQFIYGHHLTVPVRTLQTNTDKSLTGENDPSLNDNLIIHGDNLHALKALLPKYAGKIKCIYIDPPYNTGNEGWVYNDNVNSPLMQAWLEKNSPIDVEDLERHDKWLCMMWPRLHLLHELLSDDGVIFISIDDNEQHRLRMLMDEIFLGNFVTNIIWQKKNNPQNDAKYLSDNHEFVLCYAKNLIGEIKWKRILLPRSEKHDSRYKFNDHDGRGPWSVDNLSVKTYNPDYDYVITNPNTGEEHAPPQGSCWRVSAETAKKYVIENRIYFGKEGDGRPLLKRYLKDVQQGIVPLTVWHNSEVGSSTMGRKTVLQIFHDYERPFDNPKPVGLINRILQIACNSNDIILDSFAGSGTTAHAVLALNKEDGGNRKFILVECEDYADTITAERVRRVINGVENAKDETLRNGLGGSFTYCTLGEPIDEEGMLTGEILPTYEALADYIAYTATGNALTAISEQEDYCFGETDDIRFYLIYEPTLQFLESNKSALDGERAEQIAKACKKTGKKAYVYAPQKFISQKELTDLGITFCQLPYNIYRISDV